MVVVAVVGYGCYNGGCYNGGRGGGGGGWLVALVCWVVVLLLFY